jgi:hypothetical protein
VLPTAVTPAPTKHPIKRKGDVNCDGKVDARDALMVLQMNAGLIDTLPCIQNADVNGDNRINSLDALLILQFEAGLIDHFPAP